MGYQEAPVDPAPRSSRPLLPTLPGAGSDERSSKAICDGSLQLFNIVSTPLRPPDRPLLCPSFVPGGKRWDLRCCTVVGQLLPTRMSEVFAGQVDECMSFDYILCIAQLQP